MAVVGLLVVVGVLDCAYYELAKVARFVGVVI